VNSYVFFGGIVHLYLWHRIIIRDRFCVTICCVFSICVLFWHSVKLSVFDNLLLIMLSYCQHVLIFNVSLHILQIYLLLTILAQPTLSYTMVIFYIYFWIFTFVIILFIPLYSCPYWRWLVPLWTSLASWDTACNRISTDLRGGVWILLLHYIIRIWVLFLRRLSNKTVVAPWVFMFLTLIADIVIFYNVILFLWVSLTEEIVLLLNESFLFTTFVRIFLGFH
jgi:hypothetical protein